MQLWAIGQRRHKFTSKNKVNHRTRYSHCAQNACGAAGLVHRENPVTQPTAAGQTRLCAKSTERALDSHHLDYRRSGDQAGSDPNDGVGTCRSL